jgi:hypothetical protein
MSIVANHGESRFTKMATRALEPSYIVARWVQFPSIRPSVKNTDSHRHDVTGVLGTDGDFQLCRVVK